MTKYTQTQPFLFLAVGLALAATPILAADPEPGELSAQQILRRMAHVYATCKSYRDTGLVKQVFTKAGGVETAAPTVELPFRTAMVRPDRFRFEFSQTIRGRDSRYIIWRKEKEIQSSWDVNPGLRNERSLDWALAGATGVSCLAAHTIPSLLLPEEITGTRVTELTDQQRLADAPLGEVACFCIGGKLAKNPFTLWIDRTTFLVRQTVWEFKVDKVDYRFTTTYRPELDIDIPEKELTFAAPRLGD